MRFLRYFSYAVLVLVLVAAAGWFWLQSTRGRGWIVGKLVPIVEEATGYDIKVGTLGPGWPSHINISSVEVADANGTFLTLGEINIHLHPRELIHRYVLVDSFSIATVELARLPVAPEKEATPTQSSGGLPVSIDVNKLDLPRIIVREAVAGLPVSFRLGGELHAAGAALKTALAAARLDRPNDQATLNLNWDMRQNAFDLAAEVQEGPNGLIATKLQQPEGASHFTLKGQGDLTDWNGKLAFTLNDKPLLTGNIGLKNQARNIMLTADAPELAAFAPLTRAPLAGPLHAEINFANGADRTADFILNWQPAYTFNAPVQLQQTITQPVDISGRLTQAADVFRLTDLKATTGGLQLTGNAAGNAQQINGTFELAVADLAELEKAAGQPLSGRGQAKVEISGSPASPALNLAVELTDVTSNQMRLNRATLLASLTRAADVFTGHAALALTRDEAEVAVSGDYTYQPDLAKLENFSLTGPGGTGTGNLSVSLPGLLANGDMHLDLPRLAQLSPFLPVKLSGAARADLTANVVDGEQRGKVAVDISNLALNSLTLQRLNATVASGDDDWFVWNVDTAGKARYPFALKGNGRAQLAAAGRTLVISQFNGRFAEDNFGIAQPVTLRQEGAALSLSPASLKFGASAVSLAGSRQADGALKANLAWRQLDLARLRQFGLTTPVTGRTDGKVDVSGAMAAPKIDASFSLIPSYLTAGKAQAFPAQIRGTAAYADNTASGKVEVYREKTTLLTATAKLPLRLNLATGEMALADNAPLSGTVKGGVPLALVRELGFLDADDLTGRLNLDLRLGGTRSKPDLSGALVLADGHYLNGATGADLRDLQAQFQVTLKDVLLTKFSGRDSGEGTLSGEGKINLGAAGFPYDFTLRANRARLLNSDRARALATADLRLSGALDTSHNLKGAVEVHEALFNVPERMPVTVVDLKAREINVPAGYRRPTPPAEKTGQAAPAVPVNLDITINAPARVAVEGRGLISEWGGQLHVEGTAAAPVVAGGLTVRRGEFSVLGKSFDLEGGKVTFDGDNFTNPALDINAVNSGVDSKTIVKVTGNVSDIKVAFESDPALPQDEVIARLLFGRGVGQLSAAEAVQLASAVAELTGVGGSGPGVLTQLRRGLGLDVLNLTGGGDSGGALQLGKYLSDDVFISVEQGLTPESQRIGLEVKLRENLRAESTISAEAQPNATINLKKDY